MLLWSWGVAVALALDEAPPVASCLDNGLVVVADAHPGRPVVGVAMVIGGGAAAEETDQEGAAHLLEHLWFRSRPDGGDTVEDRIDGLGASHNAYTHQDDTTYATVAHRKSLRALLTLEAARLADPLTGVTEAVFEAERAVVHQEIAERTYGTDGVELAASRILFPADHPYARSIAGSADGLDALGLDDLRAYAAAQYRPDNATLFVRGALPADMMLAEAAAALGAKPTRRGMCGRDSATRPLPPLPPQAHPPPTFDAQVAGPRAVIAWSLPRLGDHRARQAALFANRVMRTGRCTTWERPRVAQLVCQVPLDDVADADKVARSTIGRIHHLWREAFYGRSPRAEKLSAVRRHYGRVLASADLHAQRVDVDPGGALVSDAIRAHHDQQLGASPVTGDGTRDIGILGKEHLSSDRARVAVVVPPTDSGRVGARPHGDRAVRTRADVDADLATLQRTVVGPGVANADVLELPNGLWVWAVRAERASTSGFARASFRVDPGWRDAPGLQLAGAEDLDLALGPVPTMVAHQFVTDSGSIGWRNVDDHWALDATGSDSPTALSVLAYMLTAQPVLRPSRQLKKLWASHFVTVHAMRDTPRVRAERLRWHQLTRGAPHAFWDVAYAVPRRRDHEALMSRVVRPRNGLVLVIADVRAAAMTGAAGELPFDRWSRAPARTSTGTAPTAWLDPLPRSVSVVDDPRSTAQATVGLACHVASGGVELALAEDLLAQRLNDQLRSALGATYGVQVGTRDEQHGLTLMLTTAVGMPEVGTALSAILATVDDLAAQRLTDVALGRMKLAYARSTVQRWQTVPELAAWLTALFDAGLSPTVDIDAHVAEELHALTVADLAAVLAPCAGREAVTVTGEEDAVRAALAAAGVAVAP